MIAFRLGVRDARFIAEEFGQPADHEDLESLKNYYAIVKTVIGGEVYQPFTIRCVQTRTPYNADLAEQVRRHSLMVHGRARADVEDEVTSRYLDILRG